MRRTCPCRVDCLSVVSKSSRMPCHASRIVHRWPVSNPPELTSRASPCRTCGGGRTKLPRVSSCLIRLLRVVRRTRTSRTSVDEARHKFFDTRANRRRRGSDGRCRRRQSYVSCCFCCTSIGTYLGALVTGSSSDSRAQSSSRSRQGLVMQRVTEITGTALPL